MPTKREHVCYAVHKESGLRVRIIRVVEFDEIRLSSDPEIIQTIETGHWFFTDGSQIAIPDESYNSFEIHPVVSPVVKVVRG